MATSKSAMLVYEFSQNGDVLGRVAWFAPGEMDFDFKDRGLREQFQKLIGRRKPHGGLVLQMGADETEFWEDSTAQNFSEACRSFDGLFQVRRVR
jgi:hypothetical protein